MAITEQQKQTTARHDLGGDALQALQDHLAAAGGGVTVGAIGAVNAGSSATAVVLAAATGRRSVTLTNLSTVVVYIAVGVAAESGKGIPLAAAAAAGSVGGSCDISGAGAALAINSYSVGAANSIAYQTLSIA